MFLEIYFWRIALSCINYKTHPALHKSRLKHISKKGGVIFDCDFLKMFYHIDF